MTDNSAEKEYDILNENMRHYGRIHFAELTVLIAITAGLITLLYKSAPPISKDLIPLIRVGGLLVAVLFWIMEESALYIWGHFAARAAFLEEQLGYKLFSTLPGERNVNRKIGESG